MLYGWNSIDKRTLMKWFVGRVGGMLEIATSVRTVSPVLHLLWVLQYTAVRTVSSRTLPVPHAALEGIEAIRFTG